MTARPNVKCDLDAIRARLNQNLRFDTDDKERNEPQTVEMPLMDVINLITEVENLRRILSRTHSVFFQAAMELNEALGGNP